MTQAPDRIEALLNQSTVTGIDYIFVHADQKHLDVHFLRSPGTLINPLHVDLAAENILIYHAEGTVAPVQVTAISWINSNETFQITTAVAGDFTLYQLLINDPRIDPYYNNISFSFKANCPSDLDCAPAEHLCPREDWIDFPVDYQARDFWTYRRALLEFASLRYPDWQDRLAADAGVMLAEVMSALADEMAYYQDRIGREAALETATQRRSVRKHARLVDYHLSDAKGARVWIDITVRDVPGSGTVPAGMSIWATSENGLHTHFEIGNGLQDSLDGVTYFLNDKINELEAYRWDEDQLCLPVKATTLFIDGHHANDLQLNQPAKKWVMLQTRPVNPAQPARKHVVLLTKITDETDPVLLRPVTKLQWSDIHATPFELDLTQLYIRGNLIPATSGKTDSFYLLAGAELSNLSQGELEAIQFLSMLNNRPIYECIERAGARDSISFLFTLPLTMTGNLTWFEREKKTLKPELHLRAMEYNDPSWTEGHEWIWKRSLVGVNSSQPYSEEFTLDDGSWRKVVSYQRNGQEIRHFDYAASPGFTLRFGDGEFGKMPPEKSIFLAHYRTGAGKHTNLGPATINCFEDSNPLFYFIDSITNPLPAYGGRDPETLDEVRQSSPQAFREISYRAVTASDYAAAAETLEWVRHAGASFRWTGSWQTVFATPDPLHAVQMTDLWRKELEGRLNLYRQAGRETHGMDPVYADIDLEIELCITESAFPGDVKQRVAEALFGKVAYGKNEGFFSPDRFTFGTFLSRSVLESVIQEVEGVKAVESIRFRRRGVFEWKHFDEFYYDPGLNTIIRIMNDPLHPERGTVKLFTHGGL